MPVSKLQYTPVRAPRGRLVHAALFFGEALTACGKSSSGMVVATRRIARPGVERGYAFAPVVSCLDCKAAMFRRVTPRSRR